MSLITIVQINFGDSEVDSNYNPSVTFVPNNPLMLKTVSKDIEVWNEEVTFSKLLNRKYFVILATGWWIASFQQLSGVNAVYQYSSYFGFFNEYDNSMRIIVASANVVFTLASLKFLQMYGRKGLLMNGYLIAWLWNWIIFQMFDEDIEENQKDYDTLIIVFGTTIIIVFIISFSVFLGSTTWVYMAETLPRRAFGIAWAWHWSMNLLIYQFPYIFEKAVSFTRDNDPKYYKSLSLSFFLYSGLCMAGFFIVLVFVQETKGVDRIKIQKLYDSKHYDTMMKKEGPEFMTSMETDSEQYS